MSAENLLVEIGTEELPPKSLRKLAEAFAANLTAELESLELAHQGVSWYASPRRLGLQVKALDAKQQDKEVEKRGPATKAAFDAEGNPTKAAMGWARGCGIEVKDAQTLETDKGAWLLHIAKVAGQETKLLMADAISKALAKLPIPKPMRWGANKTQFIRPVHTVTILLGNELIEGEILGKQVSNQLQGHRFHHPEKISINHADDVFNVLKSAYVIADYEQRKAQIRAQIEDAAKAVNAVVAMDEDLLEEVTSLVEWPVTLTATFEEAFLDVPAEALIYTMKDDQKYFPLLDQNGKLLNKFLFVSNIESKDPSVVISGNEKVVRPRLADAQFFFETDKKKTLESRLESLDSVLFQKQLGTLKDKSQRISELAGYIAEQLGADKALAARAGLLSKTDLMTEMVMEFTDVQGVMGMHYARHDGEAEDVAVAQNEQYMPRFAGDNLPTSLISCAVAIADKFDTLVGIFGIGQAPKGDKDPFALRRAAIGALRIMVEKQLPLDILDLVAKSQTLFGEKLTNLNVSTDVFEFMLGRFRAWYQDEGIEVDVIQAVLARRPTKPVDFDRRVKAVSHFRTLDAAESLAAANKRVSNILAKNNITTQGDVEQSLLSDDAEKVLASQVAKFATDLAPLYSDGNYQEALSQLAGIRDSVDNFFDNVMVMADDEAVKQNRLALLSQLSGLFLEIADISVLQK
ncbi:MULTISPECIES: glycine--tRNA ligase subunit beta [Pseudoalteromonas]|uniref:glycine--tRNA ligase subunit beta n=1 Tax=Pseudoalteromonas TaxID=53246 RepID=UPI002357939C|nr:MULTISPECIES: glycine--tRNA ligase subunit beta [Pseudoalteromonas]MDN3406804.1 glycine--tRNA ligase subunit beta [Pseudoalteromonas sp. APC 3218]MDN3410600.1 glycine--tRNA ligase subunit beta [Pseudoalteromonas sp. APC 3894]MDN3417853.1 glycine--tRNA ligase subunit beta [Pseudoalteromonas sp. APC 3227]MDN3421525.1 glycine--tRNA ligase subunit beta [Pseudoalteromonas sp. APC 3895]MDN3425291.1 glycine--tRNA ligase subunit beta [Pseudoalteromonas sp. APC 3896]|tara:strand:- start:2219 stop:4288 length:2070 start_codon:yes stop_codon:yes gene_type:complete